MLASAMPNESKLHKERENLWHPQREEGHAYERGNHYWNRREGLTYHRRRREPGPRHTPGSASRARKRMHRDTRLETRTYENADLHHACDACLHRTRDADLHTRV